MENEKMGMFESAARQDAIEKMERTGGCSMYESTLLSDSDRRCAMEKYRRKNDKKSQQ